MRNVAQRFHRACGWFKLGSRNGASAVEYGLLAALIALVIIAAVTTVGTNLSGVFTSIAAGVHS